MNTPSTTDLTEDARSGVSLDEQIAYQAQAVTDALPAIGPLPPEEK